MSEDERKAIYDRAFEADLGDSRNMRFAMLVVRQHIEGRHDSEHMEREAFLAATDQQRQEYVREQAFTLADAFTDEIEAFLAHDFQPYETWEESNRA